MRRGSVLSGRSKWPRGLSRSVAAAVFCGCRFESRRGHGYLSLVCVLVSLRGAYRLSRGVLPSVECLSVISTPRHLGGPVLVAGLMSG
jgi:hypothetical protein